ncbi:MAG: phosphoadenosine phosphosulfate reductase [Halieaceae bacterium]|jgi:phosphoadenosine phosphosulfate reductase
MRLDIAEANERLHDASAEEIVRWALDLGRPTIASTSFGTNAAVMLHLVSQIDTSIPTIWVDTGYNLRDTYIVADRLMHQLGLNLHVYSPDMTSERRNALMGGIPTIEDEDQHQEFTRQVKLDPFSKALRDHQPEIWLTGIRQEETEHRQSLDVVSLDSRGIIKVAPIFYWSQEQVEDYMERFELPSARHYFDPTKVHDGRECGLHTAA